MLKRLLFVTILGLCGLVSASAQGTTTTEDPQDDTTATTITPRPRRTAKPAPRPTAGATPQATPAKPQTKTGAMEKQTKPTTAEAKAAAAEEASVRATFADLVKAIEATDADAVAALYWNSPNLLMFNRNGSITRGWEQMKANRTATYAAVSEVKLTTRGVNVQMLGRDGAILSCLWTQSQKNQGQLESSNGRMTLVFRRIKNEWKIVHLHTSPGDGAEAK